MKVISLSAFEPQSGKDTLADFIESIDGIRVKRIAFGDALRAEVVRLFDARGAIFNDNELREMLLNSSKDIEHEAFAIVNLPTHDNSGHYVDTYGRTYRKFLAEHFKYNPTELTAARSLRWHMQMYGNNFTKDHKKLPYKWIDYVVEKLDFWEKHDQADIVIVTDTRDPKEFSMLVEQFKATTFAIERHGFPEATKRVHHPIEDYARNFKYNWTLCNAYGDKMVMCADFMNIYNNYL